MDLMQKNQEDFKAFAHVLARDRDIRETYIRVSEKKKKPLYFEWYITYISTSLHQFQILKSKCGY